MAEDYSEKQLKQHLELHKAYSALFRSAEGKLVFQDLMKRGSMEGTSFTPGESHTTAFNEGRRSIVLHVIFMSRVENFMHLYFPEEEPEEGL